MEVDAATTVPVIPDHAAGLTAQKARDTIQGAPKSGRWWKETKKARHTSIIKSKPLRTSFEDKMAEKNKQKQVKLLQQEIRDKIANEKAEKVERRKENERRRLENARKAEVVQVINNTAKLRKIRKKHLRKITIEKRDTTTITPA